MLKPAERPNRTPGPHSPVCPPPPPGGREPLPLRQCGARLGPPAARTGSSDGSRGPEAGHAFPAGGRPPDYSVKQAGPKLFRQAGTPKRRLPCGGTQGGGDRGCGGSRQRARRHPVPVLYVGATALLAVYAVTLLTRRTGQVWPPIGNELVAAFEVLVALGCLAGGLRRRPGRGISLALGAGLLAWALGDIVRTLESSPSAPSPADAFNLVFYPLTFLALLLHLRSQLGRITPLVLLDGAVAGLGTSALCTTLALPGILDAIDRTPASVTLNLSYLVGDLILLALATGVVVMTPRHPARLVVLTAGCALMAVGGVIYLHQSSAGAYRAGTLVDLTWPAAMLAMSASVWLPASRGVQRSRRLERAPRMAILAVLAAVSIVIVVLGNFEHVNTVALGLAGVTLLGATARMALCCANRGPSTRHAAALGRDRRAHRAR